jgi:acyl transferase domain-containing protein
MSDEMQKTMQFILEQQAQFAVNLQKTEERVARLEEHMTEMARAQTHMNEAVAVMADTHKHTEEKLEAFIGGLERYISSDQNGRFSENGDT